jgi:hypothetical protein
MPGTRRGIYRDFPESPFGYLAAAQAESALGNHGPAKQRLQEAMDNATSVV